MLRGSKKQRMRGLLIIAGGLLCLLVWLGAGIMRTRSYVEANEQYEGGNYMKAVSLGNSATQWCWGTICEHARYNQANALVKLGVKDFENAQTYWEQARGIYTQLLHDENHADHQQMIRQNLDIVKQLLAQFTDSQEQQDQQNQEGEQEGNQDGEQEGEQDGEQEDGQDGEQQGEDQQSQEGQSQEGSSQQMISEATRKQLEQYQEVLQQQQRINQQYFSPIPQQDQQSLGQELGNNSGEKDW